MISEAKIQGLDVIGVHEIHTTFFVSLNVEQFFLPLEYNNKRTCYPFEMLTILSGFHYSFRSNIDEISRITSFCEHFSRMLRFRITTLHATTITTIDIFCCCCSFYRASKIHRNCHPLPKCFWFQTKSFIKWTNDHTSNHTDKASTLLRPITHECTTEEKKEWETIEQT